MIFQRVCFQADNTPTKNLASPLSYNIVWNFFGCINVNLVFFNVEISGSDGSDKTPTDPLGVLSKKQANGISTPTGKVNDPINYEMNDSYH